MDRFRETRRPDRAWLEEPWPDPEALLTDLGVRSGESVAGVGRGGGSFALAAAELVAPARVSVLDVDGTRLDEIEAEAVERGVENVTTISGDPRSLASLLPGPVDVVLLADALHAAEAPVAFAEQVSRALGPGGRFVVVDCADEPRGETTERAEPAAPPAARPISPEETRSAVVTAGFRAVEEVDLPPSRSAVVFKREHDP